MLSMHFVAVAYECMPILFASDFCNPKPLHLIFGKYGHYIYDALRAPGFYGWLPFI